jgi:hypothetical protein
MKPREEEKPGFWFHGFRIECRPFASPGDSPRGWHRPLTRGWPGGILISLWKPRNKLRGMGPYSKPTCIDAKDFRLCPFRAMIFRESH